MDDLQNVGNLRVERAYKYDGRYPQYNLPLEIGCFSLDAKGKYRNNNRQMKYLSMPDKLNDLCMDLNEGLHEYIDIFEDSDYSHTMKYKWILSHQDLIKKHFVDRFSSSPKVDFVFDRGVLTAVSSTIYEKAEDWMVYASKFRSVIYLVYVITGRKLEQKKRMQTEKEQKNPATEKEIRMTTWGFKFEQYMQSDTMHSKPDTSVPVNENEKYCAVFKGKLEHHRLLFSAEVDGVDPDHFATFGCDPTSPLRYIELKTSKIMTCDRHKRIFRRYKLLKWYLQSYFAGIPRVICGFRDEEGIVRQLATLNVRDMPKLAGDLWSPAACLNFCSHFLDYVKQCVSKDEIVYRFYWEPGFDVTCEELDPDLRLLPEWYTSNITVI